MQSTIKKEIVAEGVGVHYNQYAQIRLKPAKENTGILFKRVDVTDKNNEILAIYKNVKSKALSTEIANESGASVATIEHLMSAISSFNITNLIIEINALEVPIMEGGSEDFCFLLECVGTTLQKEKAKKFKLKKEVKVGDENYFIIAKPSEEFTVSFTSNFNSEKIGEQKFFYNKSHHDFTKDIAPSKTIANLAEVQALQQAGMGLGGNLKNTLVFTQTEILNEKCLYNTEDFVKHKILDFIGDLSLAGGEIIANFSCFKSGHKLNHLLLEEIFKTEENYQSI